MPPPPFHELKIKAVRAEGGNAVALTFDVPSELRETFVFTPGQYLTLKTMVDDKEVRRTYSICSAIDEELQVAIRQVPEGVFSSAAQQFKVGDVLKAATPRGHFKAEMGSSRSYLLLASGSGITPVLSIAKSILKFEPDSQITLLYGNRSLASTMFKDELNVLKDRYTNRLSMHHFTSREESDVPLHNGRLDAQKLASFHELGLIDVTQIDDCYLCGPQEMIETCCAQLDELGMEPTQIHSELFTALNPTTMPVAPKDVRDDTHKVQVILDGSERVFAIDPDQETVLQAGQRAGLDLPFSCAGGMCCTCRCKIVSGATKMDKNYALQPWEIDAGFTLACQTRALSENVVLDFDAA